MKNIAIFASGKGSNAEAIIEHFKGSALAKVVLIITNNPEAGVLKIAAKNKIISAIVTPAGLKNEKLMLGMLEGLNVEFVILAGFLKLVPGFLLQRYPKHIINIHPALLPKFGGQGMYGMKVHEAVLAEKETESGITIHYVNEKYDEGEVILQKKISIAPTDNPETLAGKIHVLEHEWFPKTIEQLLH
jgi:phosphoribosylglycinamide formyltransferase-1